MRGQHLFLARTTLQFILATAMADQLRTTGEATSTMLFIPGLLTPESFSRAIDVWGDSPFARTVVVVPRRQAGPLAGARRRRQIKDAVLDALGTAPCRSVVVFNDQKDFGQTALIEVARRFPDAVRQCADDGSLSYSGFSLPPHSSLTRLRQRWRHGPGWADVRVLGTHPLVQQFVALYPELLRPELRDDRVRPFPTRHLGCAALRQFSLALCDQMGYRIPEACKGAILLTLSHSSVASRNPDYVRVMQDCIATLARRNKPFLFKYHPRESEPDYLQVRQRAAGASEVPRSLPVECLYILASQRPLNVLAGASSTLLTASFFMPQARRACLVHTSHHGDGWDATLLDALRITPLSDAGAFAAWADACDEAP
jgi:hypothetical protein